MTNQRGHPDDPRPVREYGQSLSTRNPKTVAVYLGIVRDLVSWLATRPGGAPFRMNLLTETAIQDYLNHLEAQHCAPRTRSKALSAIKSFCRWGVSHGMLRRNPALAIEHPTVVALAPRELTEDQR